MDKESPEEEIEEEEVRYSLVDGRLRANKKIGNISIFGI